MGAAVTALPLADTPALAEERGTDKAPTRSIPISTSNNEHPAAYVCLNSVESQFIEAAVDTLIPADDVGPGALELGVAHFIDRQMDGSFGNGYRLYLEGPFAEGTPEQGYQLKLTPAELMKSGIADLNAYVAMRHKSSFSDLKPDERAVVLSEVENGKAGLATVPDKTFFGLLLQLTVEGYFSDPIHGGNKNKAAWKMIGFPGAGVIFTDLIEKYRNKKYDVEPVDIRDLS
jgi:gluconate 2-dehydrogenase gamma chain